MNKIWIVVALCIVVLAVFSIILWIPDEIENKPVKEVNVTVLSGSVEVENNDATQSQTLSSGDSIQIDFQQDIRVSSPSLKSKPTPHIQINDSSSSHETSTLIVRAVDTENNPIQSASIQIQTNDSQQWFSLQDQGKIEVPGLTKGELSVQLIDNAFFTIDAVTTVLQDVQHEISLIAPRKGAVNIKIIGNSFDPIPNAITNLVPVENIPLLTESDLEPKQSGSDGTLQYHPVVAGDYILDITAPPYLPHKEIIKAQATPKSQTIQLSEKSSLTVHVHNQENEPIFAAKVTLRSADAKQGITLVQETSQVSGDVVFQNLIPGKYSIQASHDWFYDDGKGECELEITHDKHNIDLVLHNREYTITGTVYDQVSSTPVEGAEVVAFTEEKIKQGNFSDPVYDYIRKEFRIKPNLTYITGRDGKFRLSQLRGGSYTLGIKPQREFVFVPFSKENRFGGEDYNPTVFLQDQEHVQGVDINLLRSWKINGRVLSDDETPLPEADVRVRAVVNNAKHYAYVHQYGFGDYNSTLRVDVDNDGTYIVEGNSYVFAEHFSLRLNADHRIYREAYLDMGLPVSISPGETKTDVDIVFESKVELSGIVKSKDGKALNDARVMTNKIGGQSTYYIYADETGYYHSAFEPGEYAITAFSEGYLSQYMQKTLDLNTYPEGMKLDFYLEEGDESFEAIITDEENNPLAGRRVNLSFSSSLFQGWDNQGSDANGRFRLEARAIPDEDIVFKIASYADKDYDEAVYETTERGAKNIHLVAKRFTEYGSVSGFVVDQNKEPVTQFDIKLVPTNIRSFSADYRRIYQWQPMSHPSGAFNIEEIPTVDGPFLVSARTANMAPGFSEPILIHKDLPVTNVYVQLQGETFTVQGSLFLNGTPYQGATILFIPNETVSFSSFDSQGDGYSQLNLSYPNEVTQENGSFILEGVPNQGGQVMVRPRWDDKERQIKTIGVDPAEPQSVTDIGSINFE